MKNKTVFVYFDPKAVDRGFVRKAKQLVRAAKRLGVAVITWPDGQDGPKDSPLSTLKSPVCAFLTPPVGLVDDKLCAILEEARQLGLTRYGFIVKSDRSVVPAVTDIMFVNRDTDVAHGVHDYREILSWLRQELALVPAEA